MIRIRRIFEELRSSYWFVPGVMALVSMALAFTSRYMDDLIPDAMWEVLAWLHGIGPAGARAVLSTIAASAISVASLVFSISILILTMASSQFGPRLIRNFMNQGAAQWTLGTFLATFIFTLLVLASVPETAAVGDVPFLSVLIGLGLGLLSFAVLIFFIHHVAQMIQAPRVIADVTSRLAASIERLLPEDGKESDRYADSDGDGPPQHFDQDAQELRARASGYIQAVDLKDLVELAAKRDGYVVTRRRPGQFVNREDVVGQLAASTTRIASVRRPPSCTATSAPRPRTSSSRSTRWSKSRCAPCRPASMIRSPRSTASTSWGPRCGSSGAARCRPGC